MPTVNVVIDYKPSDSIRCQQIGAMFDVPQKESARIEWHGELPIENDNWSVGLIVGPSGSGKSTIAKEVFHKNYHVDFDWSKSSVIDDFKKDLSIEKIAELCGAVGFNTIPAWLRPYEVLSTGEKFRVDCARRILELSDPIVIDEFTSVVDRQVAQIASHAIQKAIRVGKRKLVAISCHYDIIDWLQPDWIFEPATMTYKPRGSLQRRPKIRAEVRRAPYETWSLFAPYHYLTANLHRAARCFCAYVDDHPISFVGVMKRPNWRKAGQDIVGVSRFVTLPDWQGIGIGMKLFDLIGSAYMALGYRYRAYPAHHALITAFGRRSYWKLTKKPGYIQKTNRQNTGKRTFKSMRNVSRPCAVFEYWGDRMDREMAQKLIDGVPAG